MNEEQSPQLNEALLRAEGLTGFESEAQDREINKLLDFEEFSASAERTKDVRLALKTAEAFRKVRLDRIASIINPSSNSDRNSTPFIGYNGAQNLMTGIDVIPEEPIGISEQVLGHGTSMQALEKEAFWSTLNFAAQRDIRKGMQTIDGTVDLFYPGSATHQISGTHDYGNYYIGVQDTFSSEKESYDTKNRRIYVLRKMNPDEVTEALTTAKSQLEDPNFIRDNFDKFYQGVVANRQSRTTY